jgi:hypothetical protein
LSRAAASTVYTAETHNPGVRICPTAPREATLHVPTAESSASQQWVSFWFADKPAKWRRIGNRYGAHD